MDRRLRETFNVWQTEEHPQGPGLAGQSLMKNWFLGALAGVALYAGPACPQVRELPVARRSRQRPAKPRGCGGWTRVPQLDRAPRRFAFGAALFRQGRRWMVFAASHRRRIELVHQLGGFSLAAGAPRRFIGSALAGPQRIRVLRIRREHRAILRRRENLEQAARSPSRWHSDRARIRIDVRSAEWRACSGVARWARDQAGGRRAWTRRRQHDASIRDHGARRHARR